MQRRLFKRDFVLRSADKVKEDLVAWSENSRIKFVNVFHDFLTAVEPEYSERALSEHYRLHVSYDLFNLPTKEQLDLLLGAFRGGKIHFCLAQGHSATRELVDISSLIQRIRQAQSSGAYETVLTYVRRHLAYGEYRRAFQAVTRETRVSPCQIDYWWEDFPVPDEQGMSGESSYRQCLSWKHKYFLMNTVFRSGILAYQAAPTLTKSISHWYFS